MTLSESVVNGKLILGEPSWQPLVTKFISKDPEKYRDVLAIISWYYLENQGEVKNGGIMTIKMYDCTDTLIETWTLSDCWVRSVDFGGEVYASDPDVELNIKWKFKSAKYELNSVKKSYTQVDN